MTWHWIRILVPRWYSPAFQSYREAGGAGAAEMIIDLLMLACTSPGGDPNGELWRSVEEPHTIQSLARILRREDVVVAGQIEAMRRYDILAVRTRPDGRLVMRLTWWDDQLPAGELRTKETARKQKLRERKKAERQAIVDGLLPAPQGWREVLETISPGWPECKWLEVPRDQRKRVTQRLLPL